MFGLLFSTAMFGLATIGWPVYLHVRKRREQQIQIVPSLRIFGFTSQRARKMRLQQLVLLLARAAILIFLFALVAQPFVNSKRRLSWLPLAPTDQDTGPCLGVVIDDSVFSSHTRDGISRLETARSHLVQCLETVPENVHVSFATTSFGHPTPPMSPAHAARFVETLRSVPRSGNGTEALRQLSTMLEGRPGRILVLASRDRALWPVGDLSEETVEAQTPCHFCDLTSRRLPSFLRSAGPPTNGTPGTWLFRLGGSPKLLQGRRITVSSGDRVLVTGVVALAQAMARSLRLTPPADVPAGPCAATIEGDSKHPWLTRFFAPHSAALDPGHTLVVLRPETEGALLADKILSAALLAVRPDLRIQHSRPDQTNGLPQAGAATILVDPPALASSSLDWLKESAGRGHHVLLCYTHAPAAGSNSVIPGLSVARAVSTEESDEGALHLDGGGNVSQDLNELILGGLLGLPAEGMLSFDSDPPLIPILSTADGRPVIAQGRPPLPGTWLFLATPVDLAPEGPALHPLFPLLLRRMLWSGDSSSGNRGNVPDVNASVDLCGWLGVPRAQGELVAPDDSRSTWDCTAGDKAAFIPPLPGIYRFEDSAGLVTTHCVNPAVPPQTDDMERDAWEQQHATYKVNWSDDTPPPAEWLQGNDAGIIGETARRYDLSAIALALVLLACAVESAALLIVWRRPQPSSSAVHNFG